MCKGPEVGGDSAHSGPERRSVRPLQSEMRKEVKFQRQGPYRTGPAGLGLEGRRGLIQLHVQHTSGEVPWGPQGTEFPLPGESEHISVGSKESWKLLAGERREGPGEVARG